MSMLNRRGFFKGIFGAVALIAAAPTLREMGLAVMRRVQIEEQPTEESLC